MATAGHAIQQSSRRAGVGVLIWGGSKKEVSNPACPTCHCEAVAGCRMTLANSIRDSELLFYSLAQRTSSYLSMSSKAICR